jgi:hypothetical protein
LYSVHQTAHNYNIPSSKYLIVVGITQAASSPSAVLFACDAPEPVNMFCQDSKAEVTFPTSVNLSQEFTMTQLLGSLYYFAKSTELLSL